MYKSHQNYHSHFNIYKLQQTIFMSLSPALVNDLSPDYTAITTYFTFLQSFLLKYRCFYLYDLRFSHIKSSAIIILQKNNSETVVKKFTLKDGQKVNSDQVFSVLLSFEFLHQC